jgi:hypothetical protein
MFLEFAISQFSSVHMMVLAIIVLGLIASFGPVADAYRPQFTMEGPSFWDNWDFFTDPDPTHGYVDYVDKAACTAAGIINASATQVYMSTDTAKVQTTPRKSVRLTSKASFNGGLFILDVVHLPSGCATWPAFWLVG